MPSVVTELYRIWYKIHTSFFAVYGIDFDETLCPVVRQESLWLLMALSVKALSVQERRSLYASSTKVSMV